MKTFKINENLTAVCEWENTAHGFRHTARLDAMQSYLINNK